MLAKRSVARYLSKNMGLVLDSYKGSVVVGKGMPMVQKLPAYLGPSPIAHCPLPSLPACWFSQGCPVFKPAWFSLGGSRYGGLPRVCSMGVPPKNKAELNAHAVSAIIKAAERLAGIAKNNAAASKL
jgi:hypothetical protein